MGVTNYLLIGMILQVFPFKNTIWGDKTWAPPLSLMISPPFTMQLDPNSARDRSLFNLNSKTYEESTLTEIITPNRSQDFNLKNQTIGVPGTGVF